MEVKGLNRRGLPGKTCRICLLPRDQSPSPQLGFSVKKEMNTSLVAIIKGQLAEVSRFLSELSGEEIPEKPEDRQLIAPCNCKGTMKYVHRGCLNVWRLNSTRADSYYKCEQCFTKYNFSETKTSRILSNALFIKLISTLVIAGWLYGWFAFVCFSQNLSLGFEEAGYYPPEYTVYGRFGDYKTIDLDPTISFISEPTIASYRYDNTSSNHATHIFLSSLISIMLSYHIEIVYTLVIVALFDFLILNPSVLLSVNLIYFVWRSIKDPKPFDLGVLSMFVSFGLSRTLVSIHRLADSTINRYVKVRCIQILDMEKDQMTIIKPKEGRYKAEKQAI